MATVPTQVRIDENLKKQASELFSQLGIEEYTKETEICLSKIVKVSPNG